jgi:hypothetical protein
VTLAFGIAQSPSDGGGPLKGVEKISEVIRGASAAIFPVFEADSRRKRGAESPI